MPHKEDIVRLRHMLDAAREAIQYAAGRSRADLDHERPLQVLLVHSLEIVGEAANGISDEYCQSHPEIPWDVIIGMRNRLVHAYFDINLDIVWGTVTEDLPSLVVTLERLISEEG